MAQNAPGMLDRIAKGWTDLVVDYVAQGGAVNGTSLMQSCVYYGDLTAVKYLMAQGETLATIGERPLFNAAFFAHHRLCQFLIEQGYDPNAAEPDTGETALHAVTSKLDRPACDGTLRVLIAGGANVNAVTKPGVETGTLMRDVVTRGETPLHRAAAFGTTVSIRILLDAGAVIDTKDANGETPLGWASWHRRPIAILRLLCYGPYVATITKRHLEQDLTYQLGGG